MEIALFHKHYDKKHLEQVKAEMQELGSPKIRAIYDETYEMYFAVEGCHRLRAADALGIVPEIEDISECESATIQLDGEDVEMSVSDILDGFQSDIRRNKIEILSFE